MRGPSGRLADPLNLQGRDSRSYDSLYILLDTNVFIQCRILAELPWRDLPGLSGIIRLIIPQTVAREIDNLKAGSAGRKSKRARLANNLIDQILAATNRELEIASSPLRVIVALAPHERLRDDDFPDLDFRIPDHRIVAEAVLFKRRTPDAEVAILTTDTGTRLSAENQGVTAVKVPDDEKWRLPPEQNDDQKEIQKLRKKIEELESNFASIEISFASETSEEFSFEVPRYRELSENQIEELVILAKDYFPKHLFPSSGVQMFRPSEESIRRYTEREYPAWLETVREYWKRLHWAIKPPDLCAQLPIEIKCQGARPAESVIIEFRLSGEIFFTSNGRNADVTPPGFPPPPEPPNYLSQFNKTAAIALASNSTNLYHKLNIPSIDARRDPNTFYLESSKDEVQIRKYRCEELRHRREETFDLQLLAPGYGAADGRGYLSIHVSASNIPDPVKTGLKIKWQTKDCELFEVGQRILQAARISGRRSDS